ncbi:MAG: serpin family protein [Candidatus Xenobiia bacterium LiM19]
MKKNDMIVILSLVLFFLSVSMQMASAQNDNLKAAESINSFALDLYKKLSPGNDNVFFSPYSITTALAMTYLGARGKTADEMAAALHFTLPPAEMHNALGSLVKELNGRGKDGSFQLVVANRLWGQTGYKFLQSYIKDAENYYGSGLTELDFAKEAEKSRRIINTWIEKQTTGRIKDLIPSGLIDSSTVLVLTNAIYFKSEWMTQFDKNKTHKEPFFITESKSVNIDLMNKQLDCRYFSNDAVAVAEIPYKKGELSMLILLPGKKDGLKDLESTLTTQRLNEFTAGLRSSKVNVSMPKFKVTGSLLKLKPILMTLGMNAPFVRADFSGIDGTTQLFISDVLHKAFVDVNEEGTEAAAATAVMTARGGMSMRDTPVFKADHPFIYMIRHRKSGAILFMGCLKTPPSR